ncbi:MAG: DUF3927 domain-containing protein [Betaproteobacteria bacterium]|nr:DUF3927 domain-containing protein [Betaproteobacteria bacterium]
MQILFRYGVVTFCFCRWQRSLERHPHDIRTHHQCAPSVAPCLWGCGLRSICK